MTAELIARGRIATLAGTRGLGWVEAIAISGGRVVAAGRARNVEGLAGPGTRRLELAPGEVAFPGLTDAHLHLAEGGRPNAVDLSGAPTLTEGLALVAEAHARLRQDAWLLGHGWAADRWAAWPTADDLARAAPGRRIALWAHDHHALLASHAALAAARVSDATPDPDGGLIRRAADGRPTGVLHETAAALVMGVVPPPTSDEVEAAIRSLAARLLPLGVVAVHDPGAVSFQSGLGPAFDAYRRIAERGDLAVAAHVSLREEQLTTAIDSGLHSGDGLGPGESRVRVGWLKLFADGTLGSRTAALIEDYEPELERLVAPDTGRGIWMTEPAAIAALVERAAAAGICAQVHAIGDAAVRAALDALVPTVGRTSLRPRVEHVQLVSADDIERFGASGVVASVQPVHLRSDARAARSAWGPRAERLGYAWASLRRAGVPLAFGTDAPVESIDPWPGIETAVTRRDPAWPTEFATLAPEEALTLDEALRAACIGPPESAGETDRGRLIEGQRADLVVVPAAALREPVTVGGTLGAVRPRLVLVDGTVRFEA